MISYAQQMLQDDLDLNNPALRLTVLRDLLGCLGKAAPTEQGDAARLLRLELDEPMAQGYALAWCDMLSLVGALSLSDQSLAVRTPLAGYFMQELRTLLDTPALLALDWSSEGVGATPAQFAGVDLLAVLERRRVALLPDAEPLRELEAALGVIERHSGGERQVLLVWDAAASAWQLPGGRYELRDGTLRATLLRELAEELGCAPLTEGDGVQLAELGGPIEITRWSRTSGLLTRTRFQLFRVDLPADIPLLPDNARWFGEAELLAGRSADGQPIAAEPLLRLRETLSPELDRALQR